MLTRSSLLALAISTLISTAAFADDSVQPTTNHTGESIYCTTQYDLDRDAFQNYGFEISLKEGTTQSMDTAEVIVHFRARYEICSKDSSSSTGYNFKQVDDSLGGHFEKKWTHMYVIANYLEDKKDARIISSSGWGSAIKMTTTISTDNGGIYSDETLHVPLKKLLDSKEQQTLKDQGRLAKEIVVLMSYNGMDVNARGGTRLDFNLSQSDNSGDANIQIDPQQLKVQALR